MLDPLTSEGKDEDAIICNYFGSNYKLRSRGYLLGILKSATESVGERSYEPIKHKKIQELAACYN